MQKIVQVSKQINISDRVVLMRPIHLHVSLDPLLPGSVYMKKEDIKY